MKYRPDDWQLDPLYMQWMTNMQQRVLSLESTKQPIFETDADGLWGRYLNNIPEDVRQVHNCFCCHAFVKNYGNLVTLDGDKLVPVIWSEADIPEGLETAQAIRALAKCVASARVTCQFFTISSIAGVTVEMEAAHGFEHMNCKLPKQVLNLNPSAARAASRHRLENVGRFLGGTSEGQLDTLCTLLASGRLVRAELALGHLTWLLDRIRERDARHHNLFRATILAAAESLCHPATSLAGWLVDETRNGLELDTLAAKWEAHTAPDKHRRPTAAASDAAIAVAERFVQENGLAAAFDRCFVTAEEVASSLQWKPVAAEAEESNSVFGVLKQKKSSELVVSDVNTPLKVTLAKFQRDILPRAQEVAVLSGAFYALTRCRDINAKPLLKNQEPGNLLTSIVGVTRAHTPYTASEFGIKRGAKVLGNATLIYGKLPGWVLPAPRTPSRHVGLFPVLMKSEYHHLSRVVENFANATEIQDKWDNNLAYVPMVGSTVGVKVGNVITAYHIDRDE